VKLSARGYYQLTGGIRYSSPSLNTSTCLMQDYCGRDGEADYSYIASDGSVHLWLNRGSANTNRASDIVVFADIDGDTVGGPYSSFSFWYRLVEHDAHITDATTRATRPVAARYLARLRLQTTHIIWPATLLAGSCTFPSQLG
jgi:hypothetical protein